MVGETTNLAARLQAVAEPNGVVIAEDTRRRTGGPPVRGGGGMPQRIVAISVPASVLRITGAG